MRHAPTRTFPQDFLFGAATAAYQIEGGARADGRGASIWDTFSHLPGKALNGDTGDIADDHFHRWAEDVRHIEDLGLDAYRFSISWPRVQPGGRGEFNPRGIAFYSRLVDALREADVRPIATLYHWDLPQELEDAGGWANRETAYLFSDYARRMAQELGDRVSIWTTLNEPWCSAYLGYASGAHAPGRTDAEAALKAVHHLNLAHGLAGSAIRDVLGPDTPISATLNLHVSHPANPDDPADRAAVARVDDIANEVFLQPMLEGRYPATLQNLTAHITDWSFVQAGDLRLINIPMSTLGVNYYFSNRVQHRDGTTTPHAADAHSGAGATPWLACDDVEFLPHSGPSTAMGWNIDPGSLTELLLKVAQRYPDIPLLLTENGAAFEDTVSANGRVRDPERIAYLHQHLAAAHEAIEHGVDLRGYFAWSLLDNFEWAHGYSKRFGIIRVDYDTLQRTWKDSAHWYREVVRTRRLEGIDHAGPRQETKSSLVEP